VQDSGLLYKLDQTLDPIPALADLTATNIGSIVRVDWASTWSAGALPKWYRVYDAAGDLIRDDQNTTLTSSGDVGQTLTWTVRGWDARGFMSPPATIRFKVGYGIVDAAGALVKDTVRPGDILNLRATRSGKKQALLRWSAVTDPIGLKGYRVSAPGMRTIVVRTPSTKVNVRGKTVTVAAVDAAGNVGVSATVRTPR
jgi:hypothetical protein